MAPTASLTWRVPAFWYLHNDRHSSRGVISWSDASCFSLCFFFIAAVFWVEFRYNIHTEIEYRQTSENVGQSAGTDRGTREPIISSGKKQRLRLLGIYRKHSPTHSEDCRQVCRAASRGEGNYHHWCVDVVMTPNPLHRFGSFAHKSHRRKLPPGHRPSRRLPVRGKWAEGVVHMRQGLRASRVLPARD